MRLACGLKYTLHADSLYQMTDFIMISSQLNTECCETVVEMLWLETTCLNILPKQQRMLTNWTI